MGPKDRGTEPAHDGIGVCASAERQMVVLWVLGEGVALLQLALHVNGCSHTERFFCFWQIRQEATDL